MATRGYLERATLAARVLENEAARRVLVQTVATAELLPGRYAGSKVVELSTQAVEVGAEVPAHRAEAVAEAVTRPVHGRPAEHVVVQLPAGLAELVRRQPIAQAERVVKRRHCSVVSAPVFHSAAGSCKGKVKVCMVSLWEGGE